jgi:2-dehydro-3-deoxygalactonokinase
LLTGPDPAAAAARLSGLLIGAELAGARAWWLGRDVAVIGAPDLAAAYGTALELQGLTPVTADGAAMNRAGLTALHQRQPESVS